MDSHLIRKVIIAILLALIITFSYSKYLEDSSDMVEILVAKQDIEPGTILSKQDIKKKLINKKAKEDFFPNAIENIDYVRGCVAIDGFKEGQPFIVDETELGFDEYLVELLKEDEALTDMFLIPFNMRVVSVTVDQNGSLNKSLKEGHFVDIVFTSDANKTGGSYSRVITQGVEIYKVIDDEPSKEDDIEVLLLAQPNIVPLITSANRNGTIDLALNSARLRAEYSAPIFTSSFSIGEQNLEFDYQKKLSELVLFYIFETDAGEFIEEAMLTYYPEDLIKNEIINMSLDDDLMSQLRFKYQRRGSDE